MHQIPNEAELRAQFAARMKLAKVFGCETAMFHQRYRKRIAQCQRHGGAGCWDDSGPASFADLGQFQQDIGLLAQRTFGSAGHTNQRNCKAAREADQIGQFRCLA